MVVQARLTPDLHLHIYDIVRLSAAQISTGRDCLCNAWCAKLLEDLDGALGSLGDGFGGSGLSG
jgi:hypothetical protein